MRAAIPVPVILLSLSPPPQGWVTGVPGCLYGGLGIQTQIFTLRQQALLSTESSLQALFAFVLFRQISGSPDWSQMSYATKGDLELFILLPPPLECQDDRRSHQAGPTLLLHKCSQCAGHIVSPGHRVPPPPPRIAPSSPTSRSEGS